MSTYAGCTLAILATHATTDPAGVRAELLARIARNGKSAKNAQKALERMDTGASVAIPARPEKAPAAPKAPKTPTGASPLSGGTKSPAARVRNDATGETRPVVTQAQACKLAADLLRSFGYPVPRALATLAKGRVPNVRTNA